MKEAISDYVLEMHKFLSNKINNNQLERCPITLNFKLTNHEKASLIIFYEATCKMINRAGIFDFDLLFNGNSISTYNLSLIFTETCKNLTACIGENTEELNINNSVTIFLNKLN